MYARDSTVLIDFQYVLGKGKQWHIKELSFKWLNSINIENYLFSPPYPENELDSFAIHQNKYNSTYINGLNWNDGCIPYLQLENIFKQIKDANAVVLVGHLPKQQFLQSYFQNVEVIEDFPAFQKLYSPKHYCMNHKNIYKRCSTLNVYKMNIFLEKSNKII